MNEKAPSKADALRAMREARYTANSSPPVATAAVLGELRTGDGQGAKAVGLPKGPATATNSADKRPKSSDAGTIPFSPNGAGTRAKDNQRLSRVFSASETKSAARGRDLSPLPEGVTMGPPLPIAVTSQMLSLERSLAVKPSAHNRSDAGSNPAAPTIKRGRPLKKDAHLSFERTKPWESEGMSRATWYARRRRQEGK